jgi:hypothetical protein
MLFLKIAIKSERFTIRYDYNQRIFGQTLYNHYYYNTVINMTKNDLNVWESINNNIYYCHDRNYLSKITSTVCYSNDNINWNKQLKMYKILKNKSLKCNIIRQSGLFGQGIGEKSFFSELFLQLDRMPLLWIGNGPGLKIWQYLYNISTSCNRLR